MRYILLFVFVSFVFVGNSQVSGYMGKRAVLHYTAGITTAFMNPDYNTDPLSFEQFDEINSFGPFNFTNFGFSFNHSFEFEYVVNNFTSLSCIYGMFRTNMERLEYVEERIYPDPYNLDDFYSDSKRYYYFGELHAKTFGIGLTLYFRKYAPMGGYFKTTLNYVPYTVETIALADEGNENVDFSEIFVDDKYWTYLITFELGKKRIFFNHLVSTVALRAGAVTGSIHKDDITDKSFVYEYSNSRVRDMFTLNLTLGVGWLLF